MTNAQQQTTVQANSERIFRIFAHLTANGMSVNDAREDIARNLRISLNAVDVALAKATL